MSCDKGHLTCLGPQCTQPDKHKRPLIGQARVKAEILQELSRHAYDCRLIEEKRASNGIEVSGCYVGDIGTFLTHVDRLIGRYINDVWRFKAVVVKKPSDIYRVRVTIRRVAK